MSEANRQPCHAAAGPGLALVDAVAAGRTTVAEIAEKQLRSIQEREDQIHAFARLDPDAVRAAAHALDHDAPNAAGRPLRGLPVGIKDLIDTADLPTEYGSRLFGGHRPAGDAAVVRKLRAAGALITGKTVTTEFALFDPGPTRNPHDPRRTPGGSSSGSAAAVAAGMLPVALGTQTAGSIVRPASFCGVVGFKPTFGGIDRTGVFSISETLDTVGILSRSVADTAAVFDVLRSERSAHDAPRVPGAATGSEAPGVGRPPRIGFARPIEWDQADGSTRTALEEFADRLSDSGMDLVPVTLPAAYDGLTAAQKTVMDVEVSRSLGALCAKEPALVSDSLRELLQRGGRTPAAEYAQAHDLAARCRAMLPTVFDGIDALMVPAVVGEAPLGTATGDPVFCRSWTLLHCPVMSLPLLQGPSGLPLGVQLVGDLHDDDTLLATASALMAWETS
ncbi:hypothetical protein BKD30_06055 [Tersicoccus phoenicis]|uniref:Amidase domain-containing protein n=1 Tax=Tersicoccus phoenicis TaxID=554083 RepID=A0A1R1LD80_9MICC|nr:amidase [Tersicoccus phoenicis]OMH25455.1 hypothetical protein BKD30_06055 [Tersicoccus phoenicis]